VFSFHYIKKRRTKKGTGPNADDGRQMTVETTFNEKLLEVQKPFLEKVFGRRRQS
jgi:hypothetical protein